MTGEQPEQLGEMELGLGGRGTGADWSRGSWMQVYSGRQFFPTAPSPDDVDLEDVGHALAMICRYGGHTRRFYSVAEHTVAVSKWIQSQGGDVEAQQRGLLHDAGEAYVGDMVRPLKHHMPEYRRVEDLVLDAIGVRFGLAALSQLPPIVKSADNRILLDERDRFLSVPPSAWEQDELEPLGVYLHGHVPEDAKRQWMARAAELGLE